jgi:hypothetical protein
VILATGYAEVSGELLRGALLFAKPFTQSELAPAIDLAINEVIGKQ